MDLLEHTSRGEFKSIRLFDYFLEVENVSDKKSIKYSFPAIDNEKRKTNVEFRSVPDFAFPCHFNGSGNVQHFSFVLTNVEACRKYGFVRLNAEGSQALVILSPHPLHELFYSILNYVVELKIHSVDDLSKFVAIAYHWKGVNDYLHDPSQNFEISWLNVEGLSKHFICDSFCDRLGLPRIPQNRNLTEYYNAVGIHNMMVIFASMLHERRIIFVSKRLSRLSGSVQAANYLIYPMVWQHIFIPVLPSHLMDYLSAPMPYLIGVPSSVFKNVRVNELGDVVVINADTNVITSPYTDLQSLPSQIVLFLKRSLMKIDSSTEGGNSLLGDAIPKAFMRALVQLIGGYRSAFKINQLSKRIEFDDDKFVESRSLSFNLFLRHLLHLQIFRQFVEDRIDMINNGDGVNDEFESEVMRFQNDKKSGGENLFHSPGGSRGSVTVSAVSASLNKFHTVASKKSQQLASNLSSSVKREGGAFVKAVKHKAHTQLASNHMSAVRSAIKSSKTTLKGRASDLQHTFVNSSNSSVKSMALLRRGKRRRRIEKEKGSNGDLQHSSSRLSSKSLQSYYEENENSSTPSISSFSVTPTYHHLTRHDNDIDVNLTSVSDSIYGTRTIGSTKNFAPSIHSSTSSASTSSQTPSHVNSQDFSSYHNIHTHSDSYQSASVYQNLNSKNSDLWINRESSEREDVLMRGSGGFESNDVKSSVENEDSLLDLSNEGDSESQTQSSSNYFNNNNEIYQNTLVDLSSLNFNEPNYQNTIFPSSSRCGNGTTSNNCLIGVVRNPPKLPDQSSSIKVNRKIEEDTDTLIEMNINKFHHSTCLKNSDSKVEDNIYTNIPSNRGISNTDSCRRMTSSKHDAVETNSLLSNASSGSSSRKKLSQSSENLLREYGLLEISLETTTTTTNPCNQHLTSNVTVNDSCKGERDNFCLSDLDPLKQQSRRVSFSTKNDNPENLNFPSETIDHDDSKSIVSEGRVHTTIDSSPQTQWTKFD